MAFRQQLLLEVSRWTGRAAPSPQPNEWTESEIGAIVADLQANVAGYARYPVTGSLSELPYITKRALRADSNRYLDRRAGPHLWAKRTSGTTGTTITILRSGSFNFFMAHLAVPKVLWRWGIREFDPADLCVSILDVPRERAVALDPTGLFGLTARLPLHPIAMEVARDVIREAALLRPQSIALTPTVMEFLLAARSGESALAPVVVSSGSGLDAGLRSEFETEFGCQVVDVYSSSEFGIIASECAARAGLHVHDHILAVEIVDERGQPVVDGHAGEIVLSSISNRAVPLLRYRTGDIGALTHECCACGQPGPRLHSMTGRRLRSFRLPSGRLVSPASFHHLVDRFPLREFRLTQRDDSVFELEVEVDRAAGPIENLIPAISDRVHEVLGEPVTVEIREGHIATGPGFERYRTGEGRAT